MVVIESTLPIFWHNCCSRPIMYVRRKTSKQNEINKYTLYTYWIYLPNASEFLLSHRFSMVSIIFLLRGLAR